MSTTLPVSRVSVCRIINGECFPIPALNRNVRQTDAVYPSNVAANSSNSLLVHRVSRFVPAGQTQRVVRGQLRFARKYFILFPIYINLCLPKQRRSGHFPWTSPLGHIHPGHFSRPDIPPPFLHGVGHPPPLLPPPPCANLYKAIYR